MKEVLKHQQGDQEAAMNEELQRINLWMRQLQIKESSPSSPPAIVSGTALSCNSWSLRCGVGWMEWHHLRKDDQNIAKGSAEDDGGE